MKKTLAILLVAVLLIPMVLSACSSGPKVGGKIIVGSTTEISGDWGEAQWTNNASDAAIRDLISGYSPVVYSKTDGFIFDPQVVEAQESKVNEDGTKTFIITLKKDLVWNDGAKVTAKDYVAKVMLFSHAVSIEAGAKGSAGQLLVGWDAFKKGEAKEFAGVRLLDEYKFSFQVGADYIPYYYDVTYASVTPLPRQIWMPEDVDIADDGAGAYFTGNFTSENVKPFIESARRQSDNRVSCGPYTLKSFDATSLQAVLEVNPKYKGTYDNHKPLVETIVYVKANQDTMIDALKTGEIDILNQITGGADITAARDLVEQGGFDEIRFERSGYGKLMFQCDFAPTQFIEVRHAIAKLLDRDEFADAFCEGYGAVVHGPYGFAMWMYKDAKDVLNEKLNTYSYSFDEAVALLEEGGFTLGADGNAYTSGIRYKEVTEEEAGDYKHNITVNGKILMPLIIEWASSENNAVSDLLVTMLASSKYVADAGMEIKQSVMTFDELLNYMYRDASEGDQYGVPTYCMFNLATNFSAVYDQSYNFTLDPEFVALGYNDNYIFDEKLDQLSMDMVYSVEAGDNEKFLEMWTEFILRWNELLPEVPLYSNVYYDVFNAKLKDYDVSSLWNFARAIVYARVEE